MGKRSRKNRKAALDAYVTRPARQIAKQEVNGQLFVNPLCSTYENVFPQVRPLIDELKIVRPYGVGRNGARLPILRTPELALLENPNEQMGWAEFADLMFAMWLTEKELNIHVWKNGRGRIYGYTILPVGARQSLGNGEYYFQTTSADGTIEQIPASEVMTLRYSRNPRNISEGVSPASVVFIWSQVADLLAQYQRAYLENGAVPASVTIIRASTKEKFDAVQKDLEGQLKGAQNRNKTIYLWEQVLNTGESMAQVEVKPIQGNNSTLAIKDIMAIVHDEINKAYGVSEFILGNDSSAKYDNAELSDRQFTKRRVLPALVSFWSQFQHELDRVLGGIGYAIQFDLDVPELTDRIKVKAEISQKNVENLTKLINAGSTAGAAVRALGLPDEWLDVAYDLYSEKQRQRDVAAISSLSSITTNRNPDNIPTNSGGPTPSEAEKSRQSVDNLDDTDDSPTDQGWIGAKVEKLEVLGVLDDRLRNQLYTGDLDVEKTNIPAQENPHFTVFYGLTKKGFETPDIDIAEEIQENMPPQVIIEKIDVFDNNDVYKVIVAKLRKTEALQRLHDTFLGLDHYEQQFPVYMPHITLCYVNKDANSENFIEVFEEYVGKSINTTGFEIDNPWRKRLDAHHCEHCHHTHDIKTDAEITFAKGEEKEKAVYDELTKVLENAIAEVLGESARLSEEDITKLKIAILEQLIAEADKGENDAAAEIKGYVLGATATAIAGVLDNGGYHVSDDFEQHMKDRVELVVSKLDEVARETARKVLDTTQKEGLTMQEIKKALADVMPAARAELIARNETVYAYRAGSLENAKNLAKQYGLKIKKTWLAQPDACPICKAMNGSTVDILEPFPDGADSEDGVHYAWEHTKYNDGGEIPQAHVNCRCVPTYEVVYA